MKYITKIGGKKPNRNLKIYVLYHCLFKHQTHPKNSSKDGELNTLEAARSDLVGEMWSWYLINLCNQQMMNLDDRHETEHINQNIVV